MTQSRQRLQQELILQKIRYLLPAAKCSVRPYDNNEHLAVNPIVRGDYLIDWYDNVDECPSLETIEAVTNAQVEAMQNSQRKEERDKQYAKDLTMKGLYKQAKKDNPALTFSDYLDQLEAEEVV